jgi:hypothetical protein
MGRGRHRPVASAAARSGADGHGRNRLGSPSTVEVGALRRSTQAIECPWSPGHRHRGQAPLANPGPSGTLRRPLCRILQATEAESGPTSARARGTAECLQSASTKAGNTAPNTAPNTPPYAAPPLTRDAPSAVGNRSATAPVPLGKHLGNRLGGQWDAGSLPPKGAPCVNDAPAR